MYTRPGGSPAVSRWRKWSYTQKPVSTHPAGNCARTALQVKLKVSAQLAVYTHTHTHNVTPHRERCVSLPSGYTVNFHLPPLAH